jgi:hypothetical protein
MFLYRGTAISWKSSKQTLVAMSTNHSEIIMLYEASYERVWLHRIIDHIHISCGIGAIRSPTIIYEDNDVCVAQIQTRYIKNNYKKTYFYEIVLFTSLQETHKSMMAQITYEGPLVS